MVPGSGCGSASALVPMPAGSERRVDAFADSTRREASPVARSRRLQVKALCLLFGVLAVAAIVSVVMLVRGAAEDGGAVALPESGAHVPHEASPPRQLLAAEAAPPASNCTNDSGRAAFGSTSFWINAAVSVGKLWAALMPAL